MSSPEYTARVTKWVLSQYPLVENLSIWEATDAHTCVYIHVHIIHTCVCISIQSLCFLGGGTWQTVTWPMNREAEKGLGTGQGVVFIKVSLVKLISGGCLLSPRKAESSRGVNSITAHSLMACTELPKSLWGVIYLRLSGNSIPQRS